MRHLEEYVRGAQRRQEAAQRQRGSCNVARAARRARRKRVVRQLAGKSDGSGAQNHRSVRRANAVMRRRSAVAARARQRKSRVVTQLPQRQCRRASAALRSRRAGASPRALKFYGMHRNQYNRRPKDGTRTADVPATAKKTPTSLRYIAQP